MSYVLYCDHRRRKPLLISSKERDKRLSATMTIFLIYHTITSATNIVNGVLHALGPTSGLGIITLRTSGGSQWYELMFEYLRNLHIYTPPIVIFFLTLDRLLVLLLNISYNERHRKRVVYSDLLCLALMTLIIGYYQFYKYVVLFLNLIGLSFLDKNQPWQYRLIGLLIIKAVIGGLNAFNCFAFMYQLRTLPKLKVRTRIVKISALLEIFLGIIPSFFAVYYFMTMKDNLFQTITLLIGLDSALNAIAYFVLMEKPKIKWIKETTNSAG